MSQAGPRATRFVLSALVCCVVATVAIAGPHEETIARFREFAQTRIEKDTIPGLTIGFVKGDFMWAEGFGWADLENRVPAKAESAYRLASVTKPMTAMGVLELVEQGKIDLDAEVQTYVPFYPKKSWPLTVRQVLGHLGGISHYRDYDAEGHFKDHKNTEESIAVFADFELVAEPGTRYNYSSYGYNLLGAVIEGASGQPYGEFMHENLWAPLGMNDTRLDDPDEIIPNRVSGYRLGPGGELINSEFVNISSRFAAGGTRSTVIDLLRLGQGLNAGRILNPDTAEWMLTSMTTSEGRYTDYGMGWSIRPRNGRFGAAHGGGQAETATYFMWVPDLKLAIALGCNLEEADFSPYIERLYREITGEPAMGEVYAGGRARRLVHAALRTAFDHGLSYAEHYGGSLAKSSAEAAAAFSYFNQSLNLESLEAEDEAVLGLVYAGRHPEAGRSYTVVGSYMASKLIEHAERDTVERLHRDGPVPFFAEYIKLYRDRKSKIPKTHRLDMALETLIAEWAEDWSRVWNESTWDLTFEADADLDGEIARLRAAYAGAVLYPDHWREMEHVVETLARTGRMADALKVANAGHELYPESGGPLFHAGLVNLAMGSSETAEQLIRQARDVDPDAASAGFLNRWAYQLKSAGFLDVGLGLLEIALKLHPDVANLYDSTGEFWLAKGERETAIRFYEKAVELDPEFENPRTMLDQITSP